jgi:hypothetical protein
MIILIEFITLPQFKDIFFPTVPAEGFHYFFPTGFHPRLNQQG